MGASERVLGEQRSDRIVGRHPQRDAGSGGRAGDVAEQRQCRERLKALGGGCRPTHAGTAQRDSGIGARLGCERHHATDSR